MQKLIYDALRHEVKRKNKWVMNITEINSLLKYRIRFPKKYYYLILDELLDLRLLKKPSRDIYLIMNCRHKSTSDSQGEPFW